jgi:TPR repeat protein
MDEMKPQQQRIVDALARSWDPISASEVLQRSKLNREGIATNQISAQLKVLTENQVVEPVPGPGKNKTYRIRERFFNIWYLMRYGKKQHKEEVLWLVRFLETWCTTKELQLQAEEQIKALKLGSYSKQAAYLKTMALYHVEGIESRHKLQLLEQAETYFKVSAEESNVRTIGKAKRNELNKCVNSMIKKIEADQCGTVHEDLPDVALESKIYIIHSVVLEAFKLDESLLRIKELLEVGVQLGDSHCMDMMGIAYHHTDATTAEKYYLMAVEKGSIEAMFNLAKLYEDDNNLELAEEYYIMAFKKGNVGAALNLAKLYEDKEKNELAKKYYLIAINNEEVEAMLNLANLYENENNYELTEKYYLIAVEKGSVEAMFNLALLYQEEKNFDLAEMYYRMAAEKGDADAMFNLANLYEDEKKDPKLAKKYYLLAAAKDHTDSMFNLALLYQNEKNVKLAEKYYLSAVEKGDADAMNCLAILYYKYMGKKLDELEGYFRSAHSLGNVAASINLVLLYSRKNRIREMLEIGLQAINNDQLLEDQQNIFKLFYTILIKKQYNFLLKQFKNPEAKLMTYARPFYYVLAWFMRDELPGEYEKVGPEIKETVDEIIQALQKKYDKTEVEV